MNKNVPTYLSDLSEEELKLIFKFRNADEESQQELYEIAEKTEKQTQ